jgi:hypothetical protein
VRVEELRKEKRRREEKKGRKEEKFVWPENRQR